MGNVEPARAQYDAVVQLGSDMRIQRALPRLKGLLAVHAETHGAAKSGKSALPSMHEAPVISFMPMCHSNTSKELEGRLLADYMASNEDRKIFDSRMEARLLETETETDEGYGQTEVIHVSMCNDMGQSIPVRLYHVRFMDLWGENACHLVGICEAAESTVMDAAEGSSPDLSQAKPATVLACPANEAAAASQDMPLPPTDDLPLIRFNAMDDALSISFVNDAWTKQFGVKDGSLSDWFGQEIFSEFREWVRKTVASAIGGGWTQASMRHRYRTLKCTYPNGVKALKELWVLVPDPATHLFASEGKYTLELVGRTALASSRKSSQSDSSSGQGSADKSRSSKRSSGSSRSRTRPLATLPTIEENVLVRRRGSDDIGP